MGKTSDPTIPTARLIPGFSERNHVEQQSRKKDLLCQRVCSAVPLLLAEDSLQLSGVRDLWMDPALAGLNGPHMKRSEVEFLSMDFVSL